MIQNTCDVFFVNFANKSRLKIMLALKNGPLDVNTITKKIGGEQSAVSHNLKKLTNCKILNAKQEGKRRIYSINKTTVLPILEIYQKHIVKNCKGCKYAKNNILG